MTATATVTMVKMLETLPEGLQERALEHLREDIEDIREDMQWNESFAHSQSQLVTAARKVRKSIAEGESTPLDLDML